MSEMKPCPFCGEMSVSEHANYLLNEYGRLQFDLVAYCKPYGESLRNEARNNLEEYIAGLENEVNSVVKKTVTLENKNRNLHKVIAKQQLKIQRQSENLTILLDLYTSGKRSKSHKKLRKKYRLLKASFNELEGVIEILEDQQREEKNILIDKNLHIDSLYEEGYKLQQRIAELEAQFEEREVMKNRVAELEADNNRLKAVLNEWDMAWQNGCIAPQPSGNKAFGLDEGLVLCERMMKPILEETRLLLGKAEVQDV